MNGNDSDDDTDHGGDPDGCGGGDLPELPEKILAGGAADDGESDHGVYVGVLFCKAGVHHLYSGDHLHRLDSRRVPGLGNVCCLEMVPG